MSVAGEVNGLSTGKADGNVTFSSRPRLLRKSGSLTAQNYGETKLLDIYIVIIITIIIISSFPLSLARFVSWKESDSERVSHVHVHISLATD